MQPTHNQKGFTLIEIIAILVILGILAAVAMPKFLGLQKDARKSAIKGMQGVMMGVANMAYSKAIVYGRTGIIGTINYEGKVVALQYGFPKNVAAIKDAMEMIEGFTIDGEAYTKDGAPIPANCSVSYTPPTAPGGSPIVTINNNGC
jgi:MSHA pilin protein MshA